MMTVRRDAVRSKTVYRRAEEINETAKQWVRHRGSKPHERTCPLRSESDRSINIIQSVAMSQNRL